MNETINLFLLALLGSLIALFGGVIFLFNRTLSSILEKYSVPFAAGVLVTVSLVGLIPESEQEIGEVTYWIVLASFLGVYLFEHLFFGIHHHGDGEDHHEVKDSFIDGVAIGASFMISPNLGLITALSTFLHEVPHEIGDFGILLKAGWRNSKILLVNIFSSLTTIVGAFLVYFFNSNDYLNGSLMAVSAGVFLYLGASDFLPKIKEQKLHRIKSILPLILGSIIIILTLLIIPHVFKSNLLNLVKINYVEIL